MERIHGRAGLTVLFLAISLLAMLSMVSKPYAAESELQKIISRGTLRVGAPNSIPWSMKDVNTGKWTGIFPELFQYMCDDLGVKMEIIETTWANAIPGLQAAQFDVVGALDARPKRALACDFTRAVFRGAVGVLVKKDIGKYKNWKTWEDVNRKDVTIAADSGGASTMTIQRLAPNATYRLVPTKDMMWMELESGRVDAVGAEWGSVVSYAKSKGGSPKLLSPITGNPINIALRKLENKDFRDWLDTAVDFYEAQGIIRLICEKYIPGAFFVPEWK